MSAELAEAWPAFRRPLATCALLPFVFIYTLNPQTSATLKTRAFEIIFITSIIVHMFSKVEPLRS